MSPLPDPLCRPEEITAWLERHGGLGSEVSAALFERLYAQLRQVAGAQIRRERSDHTLDATSLLHEAWFRMSEQSRTEWRNRAHFLAVATTMMRRILVSHEQARRAAKRQVDAVALTLGALEEIGQPPDRDLIAVHDSLLVLESVDPRAAQIVEMRFFGGFELDEIATLLDVSLATVKRDGAWARAFLSRELSRG
jgi:RNA polymerase sigma factor (TIGR02999 family)